MTLGVKPSLAPRRAVKVAAKHALAPPQPGAALDPPATAVERPGEPGRRARPATAERLVVALGAAREHDVGREAELGAAARREGCGEARVGATAAGRGAELEVVAGLAAGGG